MTTESGGNGRARPFALDLFCCGGGASKGLYDAGFNVVGVDIAKQPHYPYPFMQADVLTLDPEWIAAFDFVWASPPCQAHSKLKTVHPKVTHPDLIPATRELLDDVGRPYVMENVEGAPLRVDLLLCGTMFGLETLRHRLFEVSGFTVSQPGHPIHDPDATYFTVTGHGEPNWRKRAAHPELTGPGTVDNWRRAMGIDWLPRDRLTQAIPPTYSEHIGLAALASMRQAIAA